MDPRNSVNWPTSLVCLSSGKHPWANTSAHRFRQCDRVLFIQILHHPPEVCHDALRTGQYAGRCTLCRFLEWKCRTVLRCFFTLRSQKMSIRVRKQDFISVFVKKPALKKCFFFCSLCVAAVVPLQIHTHSQNLYIMSQPLLYGE